MTYSRKQMAAYQRHRRAGTPAARFRDKEYARIRRLALTQLAREYPQRYFELFAAFESQAEDSPERQAARRAALEEAMR